MERLTIEQRIQIVEIYIQNSKVLVLRSEKLNENSEKNLRFHRTL